MSTLPPKVFFSKIVRIQFLTAASGAIISVIFPLLLKKEFKTDQNVSLLFTAFQIISLLTLLIIVPLIKKIHQRRSFDIALLLMPFMILLLGFSTTKWELVIIYTFLVFLANLYAFNISIYFPRLQPKNRLMESTGKVGAICNSAAVVGPLIGGWLAQKYDNQIVFFASCIFAVGAYLQLPITRMPRAYLGVGLSSPLASIKKFFADSNRTRAFINGLGLDFVYGSWFLIPILMKELGASLVEIGLITALACLPWVLLEIPIGKIADRKISSRTLFIIGYGTIALAITALGLTSNLIFFLGFYLIAVVGSCCIEQTNSPYFLKSLDKKDNSLISVYLMRSPLGRIASPLVAAILLTTIPLKSVISIFGILTVIFFINALFLKKQPT